MKSIKVFAICLGLIAFLAIFGKGQTKLQKNALNKMLGIYASKNIKTLNKNGDSFKYSLTNKNVFYSDIDGDGDLDAIAELFFCESTSCHPTTK